MTDRIPVAFAQHQWIMTIVPWSDHDEMVTRDVDVALKVVFAIPRQTTHAFVAGDDSELPTGQSPCLFVVET